MVTITPSIASAEASTNASVGSYEPGLRGKVGTIYTLVEYTAPDGATAGKARLTIENDTKSKIIFQEAQISTYDPDESKTFVVSETAPEDGSLSRNDIDVSLDVTQTDSSGQFSLSFGATLKSDHTHEPQPGIVEEFNLENTERLSSELLNSEGELFNGGFDVQVNGSEVATVNGDSQRFERVVDVRGELSPGQFNTIEVLGTGIGHMQVWLEGDVYRTVGGNG